MATPSFKMVTPNPKMVTPNLKMMTPNPKYATPSFRKATQSTNKNLNNKSGEKIKVFVRPRPLFEKEILNGAYEVMKSVENNKVRD